MGKIGSNLSASTGGNENPPRREHTNILIIVNEVNYSVRPNFHIIFQPSSSGKNIIVSLNLLCPSI